MILLHFSKLELFLLIFLLNIRGGYMKHSIFMLFLFVSLSIWGIISVPTDYSTIQGAINASVNGDTIIVDQGVYTENINFSGKEILLTSQIISTNNYSDVQLTVLNGVNGGVVVEFTSNETSLSKLNGFTVRMGSGTMNNNRGGGILIENASPEISNCIVKDNSAFNGGGAFISNSSARFYNCVFKDNNAMLEGGAAIVVSSVDTRFYNCLFIDNGAWAETATLDVWFSGTTEIVNSIVRNSNANHITESGNAVLNISYSNIEGGWVGTGNIDADPQFEDIQNELFSVTPSSPCINTGDPNSLNYNLPIYDLMGNQRFNGIIDMGPCELESGTLAAAFNVAPDSGYAPLTVNFLDFSTGNPTAWDWDFDNDGTTDSNLQNPQHTYTQPGVYTVSLTISDGTNQSSVTMQDLIIVSEPNVTADFQADILIGNAPLIVSFTDLSSDDCTLWEWDFDNDGTVDNIAQNPVWSFTEPGTYTVSLTASNGLTDDTEVKTDYIVVNPSIGAMYTVPDDYIHIDMAIAMCSDGDTIYVRPGTYDEYIDFRGKALSVVSEYFFSGNPDHIEQTVIDGGNSGRPVIFQSGENWNSKLIGFTITGGNASLAEGGGVYCNGASPTLSNLRITNCSASEGGAIACYNSTAIIASCEVFLNSSSTSGGGILVHSNSDVRIENCLVYDNSSLIGGGIACQLSNCKIVNCTVTLNNSTNSNFAGGIDCYGTSDVIILNSIIHSNSSPQIVNSQNLWLNNSNIMDPVQNDTGALLIEQDNINSDPDFVNSDQNDFTLNTSSPCIDLGITSIVVNGESISAPQKDIRSNDRDTSPDAGCYEVLPALNAEFSANPVSGSAPLLVTFTDLSYPQPSSWEWDFDNDGITDSNIQNPQFTYNQNGIYSVKLIVQNGTETDSIVYSNLINVQEAANIEDINSFNTALLGNSPNPFNPETKISFSLERQQYVSLEIVNIKGQKVTILYSGILDRGKHEYIWNGENNNGVKTSSGVYFIKMKTSKNTFVRKCIMLK